MTTSTLPYRIVSPGGDAARGNAVLDAIYEGGGNAVLDAIYEGGEDGNGGEGGDEDGWIAWLDEGDRIEGEATLMQILAATPDKVGGADALAVFIFAPGALGEYEVSCSIRFWRASTRARFALHGGRLHAVLPTGVELPAGLVEGVHVYVARGDEALLAVVRSNDFVFDAEIAAARADAHYWSLQASVGWGEGPVGGLDAVVAGLQRHPFAVDLWWTAFKTAGFGLWASAEAAIRGEVVPSVALPALPEMLRKIAAAGLGDVAPAADLHAVADRLGRLLRRPIAPIPVSALDLTRPALLLPEGFDGVDLVDTLLDVFGFAAIAPIQAEHVLAAGLPLLVLDWPAAGSWWAAAHPGRVVSLWIGGWARVEAADLAAALDEALSVQAKGRARVLWVSEDPPPGGADVLPFVDRRLRDLEAIGVDVQRAAGEVAILGGRNVLPRVAAAAAAGATVIHTEEAPAVAGRLAADYEARFLTHGSLPRQDRIRLLRRVSLAVAATNDATICTDAAAAGCPVIYDEDVPEVLVSKIAGFLGSSSWREARAADYRTLVAGREDRDVAAVVTVLRRLGFPGFER